jgi:hypothetical protein
MITPNQMINLFTKNLHFKNGEFIILAHARSGSTNLSNILEKHPSIKIVGEPFHSDYKKWHPTEAFVNLPVTSKTELNKKLLLIFEKYRGLKTLQRHLEPGLNSHLMLLPGLKVIYLHRKNILQTAVSVYIAGQTNVWYKRIDAEKDPMNGVLLDAIDLDLLEREFIFQKAGIDYHMRILEKKPEAEKLVLTYEDLYFSDYDTKRALITTTFGFLGYEVPDSTAIDMFLDPGLAKINSTETYRRIPNVIEIEERFGSDKTGWLFKN